MLKLLLYCSYSGSAVGYQKAVVDTVEKTVRQDQGSEIPEPVSYIWTHSGARSAAGRFQSCGYFLVKKIAYTNESKQRDEQGRKVFMNCALVSDDPQELELAANGFLTCYKAATRTLGDLLEIDDTDIGYTIGNFTGLEQWFESCIRAGKTAPVRVKVTEQPISFIVLEANWAYFIDQCRAASLRGAVCPPNPMSDEVYTRLLESSQEEFPVWPAAAEAKTQTTQPEPTAVEPPVPEKTIETFAKEETEQQTEEYTTEQSEEVPVRPIAELPAELEEKNKLPVSASHPAAVNPVETGSIVVTSQNSRRSMCNRWPGILLGAALIAFLVWKLLFH